MDKKKIKKIALYIFYILLTIGLLIFVLSLGDLKGIGQIIANCNLYYVLCAIGLILIYLALYPVTLCLLAKAQKLDCKLSDIYIAGMTEHFFNGITPLATGGQPFQVYALSKSKVKPSVSTGLLMMNFVVFMIVTNSFALGSLVFASKLITSNATMIIAIIGFTMNFLTLVIIIVLATSKAVGNFLTKLLLLLGKIPFLTKIVEKNVEKFTSYISSAQGAFKELWSHKKTFLLCLLIRGITMFCYYAITFFVLKAIHVDIKVDSLLFVVAGTSFAITMVVFMPTPGASGGIEYVFSIILTALAVGISQDTSMGGMLLWRLITYYLPIFISFIFYIVFTIRIKIRNKNNPEEEMSLEENIIHE